MKAGGGYAIVLVTVPNLEVGRQLAQGALSAKLAACVNVVPRIESHYWWQGAIETSAEALLLFKTRVGALKKLERFIEDEHPYDTPEFLVLNVKGGSARYLEWILKSLGGS